MDNTSFHIPVLKADSIHQLITDENGIYIDATLGYGGHTREILDSTSKKARIYGIDKDIDAIEFNSKEFVDEEEIYPKTWMFLLYTRLCKKLEYIWISKWNLV
jgi:16S rRNA C1402 N4-methylase RsmH